MPYTELVIAVDFAIIILTATLLSIIAQKTGQPAIVAYLFTGIILGPVVLDVVSGSSIVELFSELGLAFLLFLIGFEMNFGVIKSILSSVIRISVYQTILQTILAFSIAYLVGFTLMETFIIALCTVFGATPVIVKILSDKKEITTVAGRINIGVLIIQDIYLVIILAIFNAESLSSPLNILISVLWVLGLLALIGAFAIVASRYILPLIFDVVVSYNKAFFVQAIAWGFLFVSLTEYLELSVEIGAFLAGLSLGQLRYSAELKGRIRPITNFFMIIFFSSIGLQIEGSYILLYWKEALFSSVVLMAGNFLIMFYLIRREKFDMETTFLGSINMIQVSEFSLVVGALAVSRGFIQEEILGYFSLMAIGTMSISTYFIYYNKQLYEKIESYLERFRLPDERNVKLEALKNHAIIIGYNEVSRLIIPLLKERYGKVVVVDNNPHKINIKNEEKVSYIFGDFFQEELQQETSLDEAAFVFNTTRNIYLNLMILQEASKEAITFLRAESIETADEYYREGAHFVIVYDLITRQKITDLVIAFLNNPEKFKSLASADIEKMK
ncbi:MAG: cation:proton antiporter [Balneolales bacterium]